MVLLFADIEFGNFAVFGLIDFDFDFGFKVFAFVGFGLESRIIDDGQILLSETAFKNSSTDTRFATSSSVKYFIFAYLSLSHGCFDFGSKSFVVLVNLCIVAVFPYSKSFKQSAKAKKFP